MKYRYRIPKAIPPGKVLVHNGVIPVYPQQDRGMNGFRIWLQNSDPKRLRVCRCGWAPQIKRHFAVRGGGWGLTGREYEREARRSLKKGDSR